MQEYSHWHARARYFVYSLTVVLIFFFPNVARKRHDAPGLAAFTAPPLVGLTDSSREIRSIVQKRSLD
jgi:hypothetical protein